MAKKKTGISEELREAINEAARAGAYEAYKDTAGAYVNYFKAMETLLYNYKKLAALVADEEAYCEVEYHAGRKTFAAGSKSTGFYEQRTEADLVQQDHTGVHGQNGITDALRIRTEIPNEQRDTATAHAVQDLSPAGNRGGHIIGCHEPSAQH